MKLAAATVAKYLRGRPTGGGYLCHCPVPSHGKGRRDLKPSLGVSDGDKGLVVHCFAGCNPADILAEIARLTAHAHPLPYDRPRAAPASPSKRTTSDWALKLWRAAAPTPGTRAETYLRSRGFTVPPPPTIRYLQSYKYDRSRSLPCLIAAVQNVAREVTAVQLTFLDPFGRSKADVTEPRRSIGPLGASALRLAPAAEHIGLAEGFETAWAAMLIHKLPTWATLGAERYALVKLPSAVRRVTIFADPDPVGLAGAKQFIDANPDLETEILSPSPAEGDYAEIWQRMAPDKEETTA